MKIKKFCGKIVHSKIFNQFILFVIIFDVAILSFRETSFANPMMKKYIDTVDMACLLIFIFELSLILFVRGVNSFIRSPWRLFDLLVVLMSVIALNPTFAAFRFIRVFKATRFMTTHSRTRLIIHSLVLSIPSIWAIVRLLIIMFLMFGIIATNLFSKSYPEYFGTLGESVFTLFQIMTLDSWASSILRDILKTHPLSWFFFISFIVVNTFITLNLFVAVLVNSMQDKYNKSNRKALENLKQLELADRKITKTQLDELKSDVKELKMMVEILAKKIDEKKD